MGRSNIAQGDPLGALWPPWGVGWGGWEGDERRREYGDIHMRMADSLCCTTETNTVLWSNYTPIKIYKKKVIKIFCSLLYHFSIYFSFSFPFSSMVLTVGTGTASHFGHRYALLPLYLLAIRSRLSWPSGLHVGSIFTEFNGYQSKSINKHSFVLIL